MLLMLMMRIISRGPGAQPPEAKGFTLVFLLYQMKFLYGIIFSMMFKKVFFSRAKVHFSRKFPIRISPESRLFWHRVPGPILYHSPVLVLPLHYYFLFKSESLMYAVASLTYFDSAGHPVCLPIIQCRSTLFDFLQFHPVQTQL